MAKLIVSFLSHDSYFIFHFGQLIRTGFIFCVPNWKMFKRSNVVLHCPFISWHLLVGAIVQLCDGHLNDVEIWQWVQEALCMLKSRAAGCCASRNCWGQSWATCVWWPCLSRGMDQETSRGQHQQFCDSDRSACRVGQWLKGFSKYQSFLISPYEFLK